MVIADGPTSAATVLILRASSVKLRLSWLKWVEPQSSSSSAQLDLKHAATTKLNRERLMIGSLGYWVAVPVCG